MAHSHGNGEQGHDGHTHDPTVSLVRGSRQIYPRADKLSTSYKVAIDIWIRRFKEAQQHIRQLEEDNEDLQRKLAIALEMLTDEQLGQLTKRAKALKEIEQLYPNG